MFVISLQWNLILVRANITSELQVLVMILATFNFCHAQHDIDDKYITDQISKVNEYSLLFWSPAPNTAPRDSIDNGKWNT